MISKSPDNTYEKTSRFNLGIQAFSEILNLFSGVRLNGHKARKKYTDKSIISYFASIETLYIPLKPVLLVKDKDVIEKEIKYFKTVINVFKRKINGDVEQIVDRLTELEKRLYESIQNINMYIQLKSDFIRTSKRKEFMDHLEGDKIPELDEDDGFD